MAKYILLDAVVAEMERRIKALHSTLNERETAVKIELKDFLSFIDTLEVKEVDLNNEYIEEVYSHIDSIKDTADRMTSGNFMHNRAAIKFSANTIAKVLELMGLKAQKGE